METTTYEYQTTDTTALTKLEEKHKQDIREYESNHQKKMLEMRKMYDKQIEDLQQEVAHLMVKFKPSKEEVGNLQVKTGSLTETPHFLKMMQREQRDKVIQCLKEGDYANADQIMELAMERARQEYEKWKLSMIEIFRKSMPVPLCALSLTEPVFNILVVGSVGSGKSTLINAFYNYVQYSTFENAWDSIPKIMIPVLMAYKHNEYWLPINTTEGNLEMTAKSERSWKRSPDRLLKSRTQECRSYLLRLGNYNVRLIDTPGFVPGTVGQYNLSSLNEKPAKIHAVLAVLKTGEEGYETMARKLVDLKTFENIQFNVHAEKLYYCLTNAQNIITEQSYIITESNIFGEPKTFPRNTFYADNEPFLALCENLVLAALGLNCNSMLFSLPTFWNASSAEMHTLFDTIHQDCTSELIAP